MACRHLVVFAVFLTAVAARSRMPSISTTCECTSLSSQALQHLNEQKHTTSLVSACMDRLSSLQKSLPTWLAVEGLDEIVLVDWGNEESVLPHVEMLYHETKLPVEKLPAVVHVSVPFERKWVLSRAFNLGLAVSKGKFIIKADCDSLLVKNFLQLHPIQDCDDCFYRGDWKLAKDENELHLNGFFVARRHHVVQVCGYDERLQTYGWDDSDLYDRFTLAGLRALPLTSGSVLHILHEDKARLHHSHGMDPFVQTQVNRILVEKLGMWNGSGTNSKYVCTCVPCSLSKCYFVESSSVPVSLEALSSPMQLRDAHKEAIQIALRSDLGLSYLFLNSMSLDELVALRHSQLLHNRTRLVVIEPELTLSNRLLVLASAMSLSTWAKRVLLVHWKQDRHCAAALRSLFDTFPSWMVPVENLPSNSMEIIAGWGDFDVYINREEDGEGEDEQKEILLAGDKHLFVQSAQAFKHKGEQFHSHSKSLQQLVPVTAVCALLHQRLDNLHNKFISVHMRSQASSVKKKLMTSNTTVYTQDGMGFLHRNNLVASHSLRVEEIICQYLRDKPGTNVYIAAKRRYRALELQGRLQKCIPIDTIFVSEHPCPPPRSYCVQKALAEFLLLSHGQMFISTERSSLSKLVYHLSASSGKICRDSAANSAFP